MIRFASTVAVALAAAAAALSPIAAGAQPTGGYIAVPVAQPARTTFIAGSTPFAWQTSAFVAPRTGAERAAIMCELVVKQVGKLSSFSANGTALDTGTLEKCNLRAK